MSRLSRRDSESEPCQNLTVTFYPEPETLIRRRGRNQAGMVAGHVSEMSRPTAGLAVTA